MSKKKKKSFDKLKTKKRANQNKQKMCTLYIDGMHCPSCEILIEKKLLKEDNVEGVQASLKGNKVDVVYQGDTKPNVAKLNKEFKSLGYKFSEKKFKHKDTPIFQIKNNQLTINPKKIRNLFFTLLVLSGLVIGFFIFESLQLGQYVSVDSSSALPAFWTLGLVAGLSSCAALVGGLLLSMVKQWNDVYIAESNITKAQPHALFHVGRLVSFALFGGILGLIGEAISLNNITFFAILTIVVSFVMVILALQMIGVEWVQYMTITAPKSFTRYAANESNFAGRFMPVTLGILTFFLPCGFTLIAQTIALTSGSFIQGSLIMLFFALGTLPILLGISIGGVALNSKPHLTAKFNVIAGLLVLFFAVYNVNGQLNVLGFPSLSDISFKTEAKEEEPIVAVNKKGEQVLNLTAVGFEYIPDGSMTIQAGIPTKMIVNNKGIQGCGSFMAARGLINNYIALKPGINEIDLGVPKAGTYKLTCSMGMVRPVTITVV